MYARPRLVIGDYRPQPTTLMRCENCGAGAYAPATPEEPVQCDPCLRTNENMEKAA